MYPYKTDPLPHQRACLNRSARQPAWALFFEQGCGKTKTVIDLAGYNFMEQVIDCLFVIAPNGVHRQWAEELTKHMTECVPINTLVWQSGKMKTLKAQRAIDEWHATVEGTLRVVLVNIDAITTKDGEALAEEILKTYRCLLVEDESSDIRTPNAARTKKARKLAKRAVMRRILTGTPNPEGPFDFYSQFEFLKSGALGFRTASSFREFFGNFEIGYAPGGRTFNKLVSYKNLDILQQRVFALSTVVRKEVLGLPPKIYEVDSVTLSDQQLSLYNGLIAEFDEEYGQDAFRRAMQRLNSGEALSFEDVRPESDAALSPSGKRISMRIILTLYLRLQQVVCGYVGVEKGEPVEMLPGTNYRLERLRYRMSGWTRQGILWSRFQQDIALMRELCQALGHSYVEYHGQVSDDDKERAKHIFQAGDAQWFIGNIAAGGRGLTLTAAETALYWNNLFSNEKRLQSEDRNHRIGTRVSPRYVDFIAGVPEDILNIDMKTTTSLGRKKARMNRFLEGTYAPGEVIPA